MSSNAPRVALLVDLYDKYLADQNSPSFIRQAARSYTPGTLETLVLYGCRRSRRAAVLALGFLGGYESNAVLGLALCDSDRRTRMLAEQSIRAVWSRAGNEGQRLELAAVVRLNMAQQFDSAVVRATELIELAPNFAEAWNQRAIACFRLGRYSDSIGDCHQTLELNPYHFAAAAGMGKCYLQLADSESALKCFRRALKLNPDLEGVRASIEGLERELRRAG